MMVWLARNIENQLYNCNICGREGYGREQRSELEQDCMGMDEVIRRILWYDGTYVPCELRF